MEGLLVRAVSSFYYVSCGDTVYECKARGAFRKENISPVVGDRVEFSILNDDKGVLNAVLPRKNMLQRPLVANIDKLFIVSSFKTPAPDLLMIDRLTAMAVANNIRPVIVFNKSDLGDMSGYAKIYLSAGFSAYIVSVKDGIGLEPLKAETENCICAFAGNSGVGKSSLLNALFKNADAKTGDVSLKLGRGKHTTRHTEIYKFGNTFMVDTPGFAAISFDNIENIDKENLAECFPDFSNYLGTCRYSTCSHTCEPGCGILDAVSRGEIQKTRHESYVSFYNELKQRKKW